MAGFRPKTLKYMQVKSSSQLNTLESVLSQNSGRLNS